MNQAMIDARIDMITDVDPRNGNTSNQIEMIKNLRILSEHFISDEIDEEEQYYNLTHKQMSRKHIKDEVIRSLNTKNDCKIVSDNIFILTDTVWDPKKK